MLFTFKRVNQLGKRLHGAAVAVKKLPQTGPDIRGLSSALTSQCEKELQKCREREIEIDLTVSSSSLCWSNLISAC